MFKPGEYFKLKHPQSQYYYHVISVKPDTYFVDVYEIATGQLLHSSNLDRDNTDKDCEHYTPGSTSLPVGSWYRAGDSVYIKSGSGCNHEWVHYTGFTESYTYCTKCDKKEAYY